MVAARVVAIRSFGVLFVAPEQLARATPIQGVEHVVVDRLHRLRGSWCGAKFNVQIGPIMNLLADGRMRLQDLAHLRLEAVLRRDHLVLGVLRVVGLDERVHEVAAGAHLPFFG